MAATLPEKQLKFARPPSRRTKKHKKGSRLFSNSPNNSDIGSGSNSPSDDDYIIQSTTSLPSSPHSSGPTTPRKHNQTVDLTFSHNKQNIQEKQNKPPLPPRPPAVPANIINSIKANTNTNTNTNTTTNTNVKSNTNSNSKPNSFNNTSTDSKPKPSTKPKPNTNTNTNSYNNNNQVKKSLETKPKLPNFEPPNNNMNSPPRQNGGLPPRQVSQPGAALPARQNLGGLPPLNQYQNKPQPPPRPDQSVTTSKHPRAQTLRALPTGDLSSNGVKVTKHKSLAVLGLGGAKATDLPDEVKQQTLVYPQQLESKNASKYDIPDIYKFHLPSVDILEKREHIQAVNKKTKNEQVFYQLVFDIKHCIFKAGNDTFLLFSIFDDKKKQFITEEYCLNLSVHNFPKKGQPEDCKVLFENLTENHLKSDLFVIVRIYRHGPMEQPDVSGKDSSKKKSKGDNFQIVRPYGVTVIPLKNHIHDLMKELGKEISFEPGTATINCPKEDSQFVQLPFDLIQLKKNNSFVAPMSIGIAHAFTLYRGSVDTVRTKYEFFESLTAVEPLEIDPVIDKDRHRLYVTLHETHVDQRRKRAPCNVLCKIELRDNTTCKPLPQKVQMGLGRMATHKDTIDTPVFYHTNDPVISQTYCVSVPEDIKLLETCHLFFSMWHQPKDKNPDPRGFAFLRLYHPKLKQLTNNKDYELQIFREMGRNPINYLDNESELKPENKVMKINFNLQSTKILPDNDIHRFITWRHQPIEPVVQSVRRVAKKPFNQLLIILDDLMKAIFEIMLESQDKSLIEQTFAALVGVLGEVNKSINEKYRQRIEQWIETRFRYPKVWRTLSYQMLTLLQWIASPAAQKATSKEADAALRQRGAEQLRQLQSCMRGVKYVFQLMKRSSDLEMDQEPKNREKILKDYNNQITQLFASLNRMMGLSHQQVAGVQSYAIRNFLALLDSLPDQADTSSKLVTKVESFVNSVQNMGALNNVEKLLLIRRFLEHPRLARKDIFQSFFPKLFPQLRFHMDGSIDEKIACATILQKCVAIMDPKRLRRVRDPKDLTVEAQWVDDGKGLHLAPELMDQFASLMLKMFAIFDEIRVTDLSTVTNAQRIFGKQFKKNPGHGKAGLKKRERSFSVAEVSGVSQDQVEVHRDFLVSLADLARQVTGRGNALNTWGEKCDRVDKIVSELRKTPENEKEAVLMIEHVLRCCNNLLRHSVFPQPWVFMRMIEAELAMRGLSWFASTLQKNYLRRSFKKELWQEWLSLGMTFLSNDDFALEDIDADRAEIIENHFGDVRNLAIEKISAAWDALTPHRSDLADTMIGAAVEASASEVTVIQDFATDVYFQMMKSEFEATNHMKTVETYTIDQVDQLTAKYSQKETVINRYLDFFRVRIRKKLSGSNQRLRKMGDQFLSEIEKLYDYLVKLKRLPSDKEHEDERTMATLLLLEYLDLTGKPELYNRYIHHLALMHQELSNYIEAANCFKQHADRLNWSDKILKEEPQISLDEAPEYKRHIALAELGQRYYMLGEAWEMAIRVGQELAKVYETRLFDLKALSATLEKQSQTWKFIAGQDRVFASCYLVTFRGNFSVDLKNEQFIYRSGNGKFPEPVREFTQRMKAKYPGATIANSSDPIPNEYLIESFDGKYIRITTLSPSSVEESEGNEFKWDNTNAPLRLKKYYREMETNTFYYTFQKKIPKEIKKKPDYNEFRELWITKIFVMAADTIPSLRRRIPVVKEKKIEYTPLNTAVNNLVSKNKELEKIIERCKQDPMHNTNDLSMNLNGVLDAAVMGGVAKYREAFFDGTYFGQYPSEQDLASKFKHALKSQMEVATDGLVVYEKYAPEALKPHTEHLRTCLTKMQKDLKEFLKDKK